MTDTVAAADHGMAARFRVPIVGDPSMTRPRLNEIFNHRAPVTIVTGPAGAGKTTAVAAWAGAASTVSWTRLDWRDNDVTAFWASILESLQVAIPSLTTALQPPPPDAAESFVDAISVLLAERDSDTCIVIDDLHHVDDPAVLNSLAHFAQSLPENALLILVSRTTPDVGLGRLRMEGRLQEIGPPHLNLSLPETEAFLSQQGLDLSGEYVESLHKRTEGWVAGVRLAALALDTGSDAHIVVDSFDGEDAAVADYLAGEVFEHLPADLRSFLESTSGCAILTTDLARTLSGRDDSADILEELVRRNLFTQRLDRRRDQYRYHDLMRGYLASELKRRDPERQKQLHAMTARWCIEQGDAMHAMEHLVAAGRIEELSELATRQGMTALLDGHGRRLLAVIDEVPAHEPGGYALWLLGAAAALENDDLTMADTYLQRLPGCEPAADHLTEVLAAAVSLTRSRYSKDVGPALEDLERIWTSPSGSADLDLYAYMNRGVARLYTGRYLEGEEDLVRAEALATGTGREGVRLAALSFMSGALASMSDYSGMRTTAAQAIDCVARLGWGQSQAAAHAHMLMSWGCYLQSDPQQALVHAQAACDALSRHSEPDVELTSRTSLVLALHALGTLTYEQLRDHLVELRTLCDAQMSPAVLANIGPEMVRICLAMGERRWAREVAGITWEYATDPGEPQLIKAMLLLDSGQSVSALKALAPLLNEQIQSHSMVNQVNALLVGAAMEDRDGSATRAHTYLVRALELAQPSGLLQPFIARPEIIEMLVAGLGRFGHADDFARQLVDTAAIVDTGPAVRLTASELAVLRELPSLLSMREIAEMRHVSVNTMKAQTRSIYRKLGVSGRREAVEAARRMALL